MELAEARAIVRRGGLMVIEGGAGVGKTAILDCACAIARRDRRLVFRAQGSDLEREFAFGIVRQLFERYCANATAEEKATLFAGPAHAVRVLLLPENSGQTEQNTSFAVLHGLYWLTVNFAGHCPISIAIDDAQWADDASIRWLAYLAPRLKEPRVSLIVTLRPDEPQSGTQELIAVRAAAHATIRPALLTQQGVTAMARGMLANCDDDMCGAIHRATGGNPFYVRELLRALKRVDQRSETSVIEDVINRGAVDGIALQLGARLRNLDSSSLSLAQAIAILGDDCELRHAAAISQMETAQASNLATQLVRLEVLGGDRPPRFIHPIVQHAVARTLSNAQRDAGHLRAARMLHAEHALPGRIAAHLMRLPPAGDAWIVERLREAGRAALENGASAAAAALFERALAEQSPSAARAEVLREAAGALLQAGREIACQRLQEAIAITQDHLLRAELASELAHAYAALFRWTESVDVLETALAELRNAPDSITTRLQSQLVAVGLQDARTASRALQIMEQLAHRPLSGTPAVTFAIAQGMVAILTGQPANEAVLPLEKALAGIGAGVEDWDTQAALWWCLLTAERFSTVGAALRPLIEQVDRSGSSRGLVAVYSTLGLLNFRLGSLPEADAAARIALRVVQESDFAPGLAFAATVLADIAVASGQLDEAQTLLDLLPQGPLPAGVGTVLIPAGRGRLRLAQGRAGEALAEFEACMALWQPQVWRMDVRDAGYVHARSWAAQALLALGHVHRAAELAEAELADILRFGGHRALGAALRVAGLTRSGEKGLRTLEESVAVLSKSPAVLERAWSLVEWGGALRRAGRPRDARRALAQGLDLAARCGARPLAARAREELIVAGARPRRDWSVGVEALTPSELRIIRLAHNGRSNRQIAQELYLSIKTVEGHLARAYGKLGIGTRTELGRVLGREKSRVPTL